MPAVFDVVDSLERALSFHRDRHSVLASNLANLDTPRYKPLDLHAPEGGAASSALETTNPAHIAQSEPGQRIEGQVFEDAPGQEGTDGNAVSLERELAKIDANRVRYMASSELVSRRLAMLKYAAGDGSP
jgi:flagellar basal-body rod protein FlgB